LPIYEYECTKCGHHAEVLQKFSDPPVTQCDMCKGRMKKLISHSTFHLKGTGWYVTDYASKRGGNSGQEKASSSDGKGEASPSDKSKGDSKKAESSKKGSGKAPSKND
jgi:putative FmdB family regulatory protein